MFRFIVALVLAILVTSYMVYDSAHKKDQRLSFRYTVGLYSK